MRRLGHYRATAEGEPTPNLALEWEAADVCGIPAKWLDLRFARGLLPALLPVSGAAMAHALVYWPNAKNRAPRRITRRATPT